MSNVICKVGDLAILQAVVDDATVLYRLRLFQNNYTPTVDSVSANFTEATFSGYAAADISAAWGTPFVNGSDQGEIDASAQTFSHNGGGTSNTIYGIYVTDSAGGVVYAERFGAPRSMSTASDSITYTPKLTAVSA